MPQSPATTYLHDYKAPDYFITHINLDFELEETLTTVHSRMHVCRNYAQNSTPLPPLLLDGENLELLSIQLDDQPLTPSAYQVTSTHLQINQVPLEFTLEIITQIKPKDNTALNGLYVSGKTLCTQCEPQGFRRITYFIDRPDVLTHYNTTIKAEKKRYPLLLSNGDLKAEGDLKNGFHFVHWEDPFKKPSYLFALVAGALDSLNDAFVTASGRKIDLKIFCEKGRVNQCYHAMDSLKKAMAWEEKTYAREYDLATYMIVAIDDFNMGAMENKGLNIFNSQYILADPKTATDQDYESILAVIAHEYFHNWTGNRITCRDWFQLSLKEGLTVFREQQFMEDTISYAVMRIHQIRYLRTEQFAQDTSPLAHAVQPDSYIEINNFYTPTVYEKGAELIRMLKTILGPTLFRKGMDLYFSRHDGEAVTIEDFIRVMEDSSKQDLSQFYYWYKQYGTPKLEVHYLYCAQTKTLQLHLTQKNELTEHQPTLQPLYIPIAIGLLQKDGYEYPLQLSDENAPIGQHRLLELKEKQASWTFINLSEEPTISLLRGFSSPVKLIASYPNSHLIHLLQHDTDAFNRWDALQQLICRLFFQRPKNLALIKPICDIFRSLLLAEGGKDPLFTAELLTFPSEAYLSEQASVIDVEDIFYARRNLKQYIALRLYPNLLTFYQQSIQNPSDFLGRNIVPRRRLRNICLNYLMSLGWKEIYAIGRKQYKQAKNMTDTLAALSELVHARATGYEKLLNTFYERWKSYPLVINKWFAIQAQTLPLNQVKTLLEHPDFNLKNPNRVRAVIGSFCHNNCMHFHNKNGEGYAFLIDQILILDSLNPQLAAQLLEPLTYWPRYTHERSHLMRYQIAQLLKSTQLSKDLYELATKSVAPNKDEPIG